MSDRSRRTEATTWWSAFLGLIGLAFVTAAPVVAAPAPNNCNQPNWTIGVSFLAVQSAQNITLTAQPDGSYARGITARIFCTDSSSPPQDIGEVTGAKIAIWIDALSATTPDIRVNGQIATDENNPVIVDAPDGFANITISSNDPNLLDLANGQWWAKVGQHSVIVAEAFGQQVSANNSPLQLGNIWAQTPELGSLALFGAGATGMAGYALARLRSIRRRK